MTEQPIQGIWPPHEAFYLEGMLFCTTTALEATSDVEGALLSAAAHRPEAAEWQASALAIVNGVQTIAHQAAAISRYLWPADKKELHLARGARLRAGLGIGEDSAIRNRALRNALEHFDERLDRFCQGLVVGLVFPTYVGPMPDTGGVPTHQFRAYYTDTGVFEVLGERFEMVPIVDEIQALHGRLMKCSNRGRRIPEQWDIDHSGDA